MPCRHRFKLLPLRVVVRASLIHPEGAVCREVDCRLTGCHTMLSAVSRSASTATSHVSYESTEPPLGSSTYVSTAA